MANEPRRFDWLPAPRHDSAFPLKRITGINNARWVSLPGKENARRRFNGHRANRRKHEMANTRVPRGVPYTTTSLRARYQRWLNRTDEGVTLCKLWREWLAEQVRKYEWDIDPAASKNPTIHGLRGTGILVRRLDGHHIDQIGNDIGMSRQMVERYTRFRDQVEVAAAGRVWLELVKK